MQCLLRAARWGFAFDIKHRRFARPLISKQHNVACRRQLTRHPSSTMPIAGDPQSEDPVVAIANRPSTKLPLARVAFGSIAAAQSPRIFREAVSAHCGHRAPQIHNRKADVLRYSMLHFKVERAPKLTHSKRPSSFTQNNRFPAGGMSYARTRYSQRLEFRCFARRLES